MSLKTVYDTKYKQLLIFPILLLVLSLVQIGYQTATTGEFLNKDVSLKGGITLSIDKQVDVEELKSYLADSFPGKDISVREITSAGAQVGAIVETSNIEAEDLLSSLKDKLGLKKDQYSLEVMGGSLGASFFQETFKAIIIAFLWMGIVVFIYFSTDFWPRVYSFILGMVVALLVYYGNSTIYFIPSAILIAVIAYLFFKYSIPSVAVILAAGCDIVETLAVVNLLDIKIGTAGIAAFLMLIGYSVDTDILLTTRVLKRKDESIFSSTWGAAKTGLMLTATAIIAVVIALMFAQADVLRQIMAIVLIGLIFDIINTWIQNAAILRWYLEKKQHHGQA